MKKILPRLNVSAFICICAACLLSVSNSHAGKLYKWVDKNGNISYQDQPPPEDAKILKEDTVKATQSAGSSARSQPSPLVVYTVANCNVCTSFLSNLEELGVPTEERLLDDDRAAQSRLLEQTGGLTVPTVLLNDRFIVNIQIDSLVPELKEAGYTITEETTAPNTNGDRNEASSDEATQTLQ